MKLIYGFHMPLFFIISGFLDNNKCSFSDYLKKLLSRYIVSYFILCGINLGLQTGMQHIGIIQGESFWKYIVGILYSRGSVEWMPNCSPLWFLTCLFCALLIYKGIQKFRNSGVLYYFILFIIVCMSLLLDYCDFNKLPWNIDSACFAVLFLEIGNSIKKYNVLNTVKMLSSKTRALLFLILLMVAIITIYFNQVEYVSVDGNSYGVFLLCILGAFSASFTVISILFIYYETGILSSAFIYLGRHTIFIMGFDYFSGTIIGAIMWKLGMANWVSIFIGKLFMLVIGSIVWAIIVEKIPTPKIRKFLQY